MNAYEIPLPMDWHQVQNDDCYTCKAIPTKSSPNFKLVNMILVDMERERHEEIHSSSRWINPLVGYVLNHCEMLAELKMHVTWLKRDIEAINADCTVVDGVITYPTTWGNLAPIVIPRITFFTPIESKKVNTNLRGEMPCLMKGPAKTFLNEHYWRQRYLEKKARKMLIARDYFKPDFFQQILSDVHDSSGWIYRKTNRKYMTMPCVYNKEIRGMEVLCFPYILFNREIDAKQEAMNWFFDNKELGHNFFAPIFELNLTSGQVTMADKITLAKEERGTKRKLASDETKRQKDDIEESLSDEMEKLEIDEDNVECEKIYERGHPNERSKRLCSQADKLHNNSVYGAAIAKRFLHLRESKTGTK